MTKRYGLQNPLAREHWPEVRAFVTQLHALAISRVPDPNLTCANLFVTREDWNDDRRNDFYIQRALGNINNWVYGETSWLEEDVPVVGAFLMGHPHWDAVAHTVFHEFGHVLTPYNQGHTPEWFAACQQLGLLLDPDSYAGERKLTPIFGNEYSWDPKVGPQIRALCSKLPPLGNFVERNT